MRYNKNILLFLGVFFCGFSASCWTQKIEAENITSLKVTGFQGDVTFNGVPNAKFFQVQVTGISEVIVNKSEEVSSGGSNSPDESDFLSKISLSSAKGFKKNSPWKLVIHQDGSQLGFKFQGPKDKDFWKNLIGGKASKHQVRFIVKGPPRKLALAWRKGQVDLADWGADTHLSLESGQMQVKNTKGFLRATLMSGGIKMNRHEGLMNVDAYQAKVSLAEVEGNIVVQNFSGSSVISNTKGALDFSSYTGALAVKKGKGQVSFESHSGAVDINGFHGRLEGKNSEGPITLNVVDKPNVKVNSDSGTVKIKLPKASGAWVNVGSVEGVLYIPPAIKRKRLANLKWARGRLSGSPQGSVHVRTQSGAVTVR